MTLAPISERPSPVTIRRLEYLHSLREKLDPAFFTRPLAIVWQDGRPALLLKDPGGTVLEQRLSRPLKLKVALKLGIGIAPSRSRLGAWEISGVRYSRKYSAVCSTSCFEGYSIKHSCFAIETTVY